MLPSCQFQFFVARLTSGCELKKVVLSKLVSDFDLMLFDPDQIRRSAAATSALAFAKVAPRAFSLSFSTGFSDRCDVNVENVCRILGC